MGGRQAMSTVSWQGCARVRYTTLQISIAFAVRRLHLILPVEGKPPVIFWATITARAARWLFPIDQLSQLSDPVLRPFIAYLRRWEATACLWASGTTCHEVSLQVNVGLIVVAEFTSGSKDWCRDAGPMLTSTCAAASRPPAFNGVVTPKMRLDAEVTRPRTDLAMSVRESSLLPAADCRMESASASMTASAQPAR